VSVMSIIVLICFVCRGSNIIALVCPPYGEHVHSSSGNLLLGLVHSKYTVIACCRYCMPIILWLLLFESFCSGHS
jgi:hypothetical protein